MKKSIVALLVVLALVILVSPGIIGRLAERSLEEDLDTTPKSEGEVIVTPQGFQRGWFSSEGRHRVELRESHLTELLRHSIGGMDAEGLPVLIVDTHLDHGLIPLGSMTREHGSLMPGLGRAVSTLQLEWPDGTTVDLPGNVYSSISLGGDLKSNYVLPAGSVGDAGQTTSWGNVDVNVSIASKGESAALDATVDSASFSQDGGAVTVGKLAFSGSASRSGKGRLGGRSTLDLADVPLADLGAGDVHVTLRFDGIDAAAFDDVVRVLKKSAVTGTAPASDAELRRFVAAGFEFDIDRFEVTTPDGPFSSALHLHVKPMDDASFSWPSALLALDAGAELRMPVKLFERAVALEPNLNALAGLGYLRREGDFYELHAAFRKGLLTVNDAPIPIPLPAVR